MTDRQAGVNECANADGAARTKRGAVGFESAVLQRVTLDRGPLIQDAVVADRGESPVRDVDSVVKDPLADPDAHHPPDHVLEWRAVERAEILLCRRLEQALGQPEVPVTNGADCGLERAACRD